MKKVSFVITDMTSGGAERVMSLLANNFASRGIEIQILAIKSEKIVYPLDKRIRYHYIGSFGNPVFKFFGRLKEINQKTKDSDVIISFLWHCNVYTLLANLFNHRKIIISERSDPSNEMRGFFRYFKWMRNLCYLRADRIVFQTEDAMNYYHGRLHRIGVVIPNPLSPEIQGVSTEERENILVAAGRFTEQKNLPMMINSFYQIHSVFPEYKLMIYGEGEMKEELIAQRNRLGLTEFIEFPGFSKNLLQDIKKAKLFLSSSDFEGISNSLIEALALGIPAVATNCPVGGSRQFVKTGYNGILIPVRDENALTDAIIKILSSDILWREMCNNAVTIKNDLSIERIGEMWEQVII